MGSAFRCIPAAPLSLIDTSHLPISEEQAKAINQTLAVPVGLALPDPKGEQFNLLPPEVVEERRAPTHRTSARRLRPGAALAVGGRHRCGDSEVRSNKNKVSALQTQVTFINKVEIPKYDKVVALANQVQALQTEFKPLVASEVDWLVVMNQFGEYLPSDAVLSDIQMTVSSLPGAASSNHSSTTPSTAGVIGTGTASVAVPNLTSLPAFGNSMSNSPVLTLGPLSGTLTTQSSVVFTITFDINHNASSRRISDFSQPIP